jgi:hypothetical protein
VSPPAPFVPASTIVCSQASEIGGGCTLPGNGKKT